MSDETLAQAVEQLAYGIKAGTLDFMAGYNRAGSGLSTRMSGETAAMVVQVRSEMEGYLRALLDEHRDERPAPEPPSDVTEDELAEELWAVSASPGAAPTDADRRVARAILAAFHVTRRES